MCHYEMGMDKIGEDIHEYNMYKTSEIYLCVMHMAATHKSAINRFAVFHEDKQCKNDIIDVKINNNNCTKPWALIDENFYLV